MNVFESRDYKEILTAKLADPSAPRGYQGKLAMVAKCQKSFMSQVVKGDGQLNLDQAARLTKHWKYSDEETDYFLTLVQYARAGSRELKAILDRRLEKMQTQNFKPRHTYTDAFEIPGAKQAAFYNYWYVSAVYMLIGVGLSVEEMAAKLRLPENLVNRAIETLKGIDLIREHKGHWIKTEGSLWLNDSPFVTNFRSAWRSYGMLRMPMEEDDELFYSSLFSLDKQTVLAFYQEISKCIAALKKKSHEGMKETDLVCVNIDYFKV